MSKTANDLNDFNQVSARQAAGWPRTDGVRGPVAPDPGSSRDGAGAMGWRNFMFLTVMTGLLAMGWSYRTTEFITPKEGIGYRLGVLGGTLMVLMMLYPLRKRLRRMHSWGGIRPWFVSHMVMGVLAPVAILFHCNFGLGAANSNMALYALFIVVLSGLVGRFLHVRTHLLIKGCELSLSELSQHLGTARCYLVRNEVIAMDAVVALKAFEDRFRDGAALLPVRIWRWLTLGVSARSARRHARRQLAADLTEFGARSGLDDVWVRVEFKKACRLIDEYVDAVRVIAEYRAYVRLFSLWHYAHMPFIGLLFITGVVHVFAVHWY